MKVTNQLGSYRAAKAKSEIMPSVEHCQDNGQNNRAENLDQNDETTREDDEKIQVGSFRRSASSQPSG